jgi:Flp pilus assembly protein TadG
VRVLLSRRERDERGVTAVLVGILSVFLVGIAAFTVDAGAAFVSNRNLQRAADAGALAAAQYLTQFPGTCNNIVSNSDAIGDAHEIAIDVAQANYKNTSWAETGVWDVRCDPDLKVLEVEFGNGIRWRRGDHHVAGR